MKLLRIIPLLALMAILGSCSKTYRSSIMLRAEKDFAYDTLKDTSKSLEFRISPNDILDFRLFTNDGFKLIDLSTLNDNNRLNQQMTTFYYLIEHDGQVKLPMIGRIPLSGLTIKEAEKVLEKAYAKYYIDPFARLQIINRRVIVFNGQYSEGTVVAMENRNLTLMEAIALAGGLPKSGKAHNIKVIRNNSSADPQIYHIDLSHMDGLAQSSMVLQSNDVIYVEPRISPTTEGLREIAPIITMLTSILSMTILITRLQ